MKNPQLQQSLVDLVVIPQGLVGICAETIDGGYLVEINANEIFPGGQQHQDVRIVHTAKKSREHR